MALQITIDIFSGRPNPVVTFDDREEREILERLRPAGKIKRGEQRPLPASTLGYRGLVIEQLDDPKGDLPKAFRYAHGDLIGPRLNARAADPAFEDFVCGTVVPRLELPRDTPDAFLKEIDRYRVIRDKFVITDIVFPIYNPCKCAPLYEPAWWNQSWIQPHNNCYNYATNYRTNTYAQPGEAAGAKYTAFTCASVRPAAEADKLINHADADNACPDEGHLVALVIWPGYDYHWYRKGRNKRWSHKPGGTPVTNLDNSGNYITDPRTADRGGYTVFCTFMDVMHGHIKIS